MLISKNFGETKFIIVFFILFCTTMDFYTFFLLALYTYILINFTVFTDQFFFSKKWNTFKCSTIIKKNIYFTVHCETKFLIDQITTPITCERFKSTTGTNKNKKLSALHKIKSYEQDAFSSNKQNMNRVKVIMATMRKVPQSYIHLPVLNQDKPRQWTWLKLLGADISQYWYKNLEILLGSNQKHNIKTF